MKAVLVVSFGTSIQEARIKNIESLEKQIGEAFPRHQIFRAFTSGTIIKKLRERDGLIVFSLREALEYLRELGVTHLIVQPTHMIPGIEHDKLMEELRGWNDSFTELKVGAVLLSDREDQEAVAKGMLAELPTLESHEACVLLGHGTEHACHHIYQQMESVFHRLGHPHIYLGTVEAHPGVVEMIKRLKREGIKDVVLFPFMLVAGDHAVNDMAGDDDDSWKNCMENAGFGTECVLKGLGEYDLIRALYVSHAKEAKPLCL